VGLEALLTIKMWGKQQPNKKVGWLSLMVFLIDSGVLLW